ncbi:MAG: class I SAM-dependent methyltransferase [Candidatus Kapaibacterium sp.]
MATLSGGRMKRIGMKWGHHQAPPRNWWDIPEVERRWNRRITGDPDLSMHRYVARKYFPRGEGVLALSLGCGAGSRELDWVVGGGIRLLEACDISWKRIAHARRIAREEGVDDTLRFFRQDVYELDVEPARYDVIIVEGALHHFRDIGLILERINRWLKPDGILIVNEYVGPSRFQWTDRQLESVNGLMALLPHRYRTVWGGKRIKRRVYRPGRLSLYLNDPSEATESAKIGDLLPAMFEVKERAEYGGTVLQLLFKDIAHHFLSGDADTAELLRFCFDAEDLLLRQGELQSDFSFFVCAKRRDPSAGTTRDGHV